MGKFLARCKHKLCALGVVLTVAIMGVVPAFATGASQPELPSEPVSSGIQSALTSAFGSMKDDVLGVIVAALPIGLIIFGSLFAIRKGKQAFNTISK